jgi:hypothetical protein
VVIQRDGDGAQVLDADEALETLMANSADAFGFPPYPAIAPFLRRWGGDDLAAAERAIVAQALDGIPAVLLRSATLNWHERLPALPKALAAPEARPARTPVPALRPA